MLDPDPRIYGVEGHLTYFSRSALNWGVGWSWQPGESKEPGLNGRGLSAGEVSPPKALLYVGAAEFGPWRVAPAGRVDDYGDVTARLRLGLGEVGGWGL